MPRFQTTMLSAVIGLGLFAPAALAKGDVKKAPEAKVAKAPAPKKAPPRKVIPVKPAHKKKLAELYAGFKFGMTKDEVIGVFAKQLDEGYEEKIKATSDIAAQDRIRKEKKNEVARLQASFISFEAGKPSPWDVSIVEEEFAHGTDEAMLERWENQGGKNQRRFFFFYNSKLWKMLVSLDVSIHPEDKKKFETFRGVMTGQYGPGDVEPGLITWRTDEFDVRAIDKLKSYDALALTIEQPKVRKEVLATRLAKAPPKKEMNSVIKAVIDPDQTDKPDVNSNNNAVDEVIKAQGGAPKKK